MASTPEAPWGFTAKGVPRRRPPRAGEGRAKRPEVSLEDSIVVGTWRAFPFDGTTWAVEPVLVDTAKAVRQREYHDTLVSALQSLSAHCHSSGGKGVLKDLIALVQQTEDAIYRAVANHAEVLRLHGLPLGTEDR